jgi:hypothetical protein
MYLAKSPGNIASICKIEVVESIFVALWPPVANGIIALIPPLVGASWNQIYFTSDTAHVTIKEITTDGAKAFAADMKFRSPHINKANTTLLMQIKDQHLVFKITLLNGGILILGSIENPVRLNPDLFDVGESARDSNHYALSVSQISINPPPLVA